MLREIRWEIESGVVLVYFPDSLGENDVSDLRDLAALWLRGLERSCGGPNDLFEVASNNSPDPEDDDDAVHEPQDYTGDYPLEGDDGESGE